ncbi:hypothetical protein [Streptomyces sp. ISL-100]|uniref:hypothetical protein n=1 Tax=Streptomyces sp. ISL-100 TaxID=2819173 RepID=UPI001BE5DF51|nr:hypothetical protein [Streptomyces sp. ISL-100]MBT2395435.1 hypothetical protein [Streptomyces sp. ISL-100]
MRLVKKTLRGPKGCTGFSSKPTAAALNRAVRAQRRIRQLEERVAAGAGQSWNSIRKRESTDKVSTVMVAEWVGFNVIDTERLDWA